jgi:predicted MFS family arabinose efflux permease
VVRTVVCAVVLSLILFYRVISTVGNVWSASLAKRVGLIQAMVATHLPSSIFLALLPAPPQLSYTICLLVARAVLNSMDQAPRSAFLSVVVLPQERTAVMGVVNILKTLSQSAGPWATGLLADHGHFWVAFVAAGSLKGTYDLLLLAFFAGRVHQPPDTGLAGQTNADAVEQASRAPETAPDISEDASDAGVTSATRITSNAEEGAVAKIPFRSSGSN